MFDYIPFASHWRFEEQIKRAVQANKYCFDDLTTKEKMNIVVAYLTEVYNEPQITLELGKLFVVSYLCFKEDKDKIDIIFYSQLEKKFRNKIDEYLEYAYEWENGYPSLERESLESSFPNMSPQLKLEIINGDIK